MEGHTEIASGVWTTPECPFRVEYVPKVLDDIRVAVMDAFFSIPRGGAEIGGILLGTYADGRVTIAGYHPVECEHAFGPGFTLSIRDKGVLAAVLAEPTPPEFRPVGWYHSHTRSEIFLSEADLEIYNSYFPEPWQVALVVKPHTFQPSRAGFFFRGHGGEVHRAASYREFVIEPLAAHPPAAAPPPMEKPGAAPERRSAAHGSGLPFATHGFTVQQELALDSPAAEPSVVEPAIPEPARVAPPVWAPADAEPVLATSSLTDEAFVESAEEEPVSAAPPAVDSRVQEPVPTPDPPVESLIVEPANAEPVTESPQDALEVSAEPATAPPPDLQVVRTPEPPQPPEEIPGLEGAAVPEFKVPDFLKQPQPRRFPKWATMVAPPVCVLAIGFAIYATRAFWAPQFTSALGRLHLVHTTPVAPALPPTLGLNAIGNAGQLQIRWDSNSPAFRNAGNTLLEIMDSGAAQRAIPLDAAHVASGSFTYTPGGEKVDVVLMVEQSNGRELRESTTFLGRPQLSPNDAATLREKQDALTKENTQLEADLKEANERNRKLQKSLADERELLRIRQRLANQNQK